MPPPFTKASASTWLGDRIRVVIGSSSRVVHADPPPACREEEAFYARYDWCLNPILTVGQLFQRLHEEIAAAPGLTAPWQREEARINLYLFVCAIAATVDDYLSRSIGDLSPIAAHFPRLRPAVRLAERVQRGVESLRGAMRDRAVARWGRRWRTCVDAACDVLIAAAEPGDRRWIELESRLREESPASVPSQVLGRRMAIPAAFRNQDLTHHDVATLADRVASKRRSARRVRPLVVAGLRTAGAYFAPLLAAHLTARGVPDVSWMTIRPKRGPSSGERRRLRTLRADGADVVVVDEPPNSGGTFRLALAILARAGVPQDRVTVAVPRSPAKADWTLPGSRLVLLDPPDYHKVRLLEPAAIAPLLQAYCGENTRIPRNAQVDALNARLRELHREGFHVRHKRVMELRDIHPGAPPTSMYVVAKSVGWGWLGYHAYIAGMRLAGMVPRVLGLRDGLLISEWVGALEVDAARAAPDVPISTLATYLAARARRLRLLEDPGFDGLADVRTGWRELVNLLRRAYGLYFGRLKIAALRRRLRRLIPPQPALIDGRMRPKEWVANGSGTFKADFEHHNFGKTELNVVDPAYDLGVTTLEFGQSPTAERQLVETYARESGDAGVEDRVVLYQLLHGVQLMNEELARASSDDSADRHEWNRRYLTTRHILASLLNRFLATHLSTSPPVKWTKRLFFLDLDGVFDSEAFGFPHTTTSGLAALDLLRAHGFSVLVHTGRSVEDVRSYCRDYGLPGGVGELGSVLVDAVADREIPLIDDQARAQLERCRTALTRLPGVFVDPMYRHAVRAYRITDERTVPLPRPQVEEVLREERLDRLKVSPSSVDVIVLARGVDKGQGLKAAKEYLGCADQPVAAIGDSDRDVPMLVAADLAYAPSGCSAAVRALGAEGRCRILRQPMQHGLLRAARELARQEPAVATLEVRPAGRLAPAADLLKTLLRVAERSRFRQFLGALAWWRL